MIGSFWNLCRACPSMPVDKLHSEYRSTYRWHEYRGGSNVVRQPPVPAPDALPPTTAPMEPAMPRRKKYPGVAYKANEFFDASLANGRDVDRKADRARSTARAAEGGAGRRSQSEGPRPLRPSRWADTVETKGVPASIGDALAPTKDTVDAAGVSTEYRKQFAWPKDGETPRKSASMGALKAAAAQARKAAQDERDGPHETEPLMNHVGGAVPKNEAAPKRYIEDYLWNGQKPGVHRRLKGKAASLERDDVDGATEKMLPKQIQVPSEGQALPSVGLANGDSWYREVLDLRKQAGEYKCRGWGTELAPEHISELYNKQMELWYQVSRRSSLSALSLASTNHRALPKTENEKDTEKTPKSPKKLKSFLSGPHQSIHAKLLESRQQERTSQKTSPQKKKKLQGHSFDEGSVIPEGGRDDAQSAANAAANVAAKAGFKSPKRRPRSADPVKPIAVVDDRPRPIKPTGLALNSKGNASRTRRKQSFAKTPSPSTVIANSMAKRRSRSVCKVVRLIDDETVPTQPRSASVAKDHVFDDSPVVKSPPEPTRVKSPEQMNMRSPDPVNWTVPLDTGKTFTVTQNVKHDENMKRPNSEFRCNSLAEETETAGNSTASAMTSQPVVT